MPPVPLLVATYVRNPYEAGPRDSRILCKRRQGSVQHWFTLTSGVSNDGVACSELGA